MDRLDHSGSFWIIETYLDRLDCLDHSGLFRTILDRLDHSGLFWTILDRLDHSGLFWTTLDSGVSILPYLSIHTYKKTPNFSRFYKNWVHSINNSDVIRMVIDQSQPGVFYLQKVMNFMKPGVFYLQKIMNFMKMRTFYKKNYLFL